MASATDATPGLAVASLSKTFAGTKALDDVSLSAGSGEIHALVGGNGSGKSTLIKILAGVHRGDPGGEVQLHGTTLASDAITPAEARAAGLRFVHQDPGVFPGMTVGENMAMGHGFPTRLGRVRWREMSKRTAKVLQRFEVPATPQTPIELLRQADQTMVAIARALQDEEEGDVSVLVLDEPTASLPEDDVELLLSALRRLAAAGQTILYVSHRLDEVLGLADAVTVLRDGKHVVTRPMAGVTEGDLIGYIVGGKLAELIAHADAPPSGDVILEVEGLTGAPVHQVNLRLHRGEVLGIAGIVGSGRTELLRMIFGAHVRDGGTVRLDGDVVEIDSPSAAMDRGLAYVPENRAVDASLPELTVRENVSLAQMASFAKWGRVSERKERAMARRSIADFDVRTTGDEALFSSLSGGNQQKVILARWLTRRPRVLLLDEPTQGVDVSARADVHRFLRDTVATGSAALFVSSDFEELAQVCDRVVALRDGRIVGEVRPPHLDRASITEAVYASGGA
jgi:ribose transport system ATP-binding protein